MPKANQDSILEVCEALSKDENSSEYLKEIINLIQKDSLNYGAAIFCFISNLGRYNSDFCVTMIESWIDKDFFIKRVLGETDEISH